MAKDYKLCPKCNNALDINSSQCPYCGKNLGISFGNNRIYGDSKTVQTKGCSGTLKIIFIVFFIVPLITSIISFIMGIISSLL